MKSGTRPKAPRNKDKKTEPVKPHSHERDERHSGSGADSALQRLRQWERGRAALASAPRDKPGR